MNCNDCYYYNTAISRGHLDCLKYLHNHMSGPSGAWNEETCVYAVMYGNLECLKYLHQEGCPWDQYTCDLAAAPAMLTPFGGRLFRLSKVRT